MQNPQGNAEKKYYRDRAKLMDFFGVIHSRWRIRRSGKAVYAESELGNTIWANNVLELQNLLLEAGVDPKDIKN